MTVKGTILCLCETKCNDVDTPEIEEKSKDMDFKVFLKNKCMRGDHECPMQRW